MCEVICLSGGKIYEAECKSPEAFIKEHEGFMDTEGDTIIPFKIDGSFFVYAVNTQGAIFAKKEVSMQDIVNNGYFWYL